MHRPLFMVHRQQMELFLVTSKRGAEAAKPTFRYEFYKGVTTPTMLPTMADATTYAQMIREMQSYKNTAESNMSYSLADIREIQIRRISLDTS